MSWFQTALTKYQKHNVLTCFKGTTTKINVQSDAGDEKASQAMMQKNFGPPLDAELCSRSMGTLSSSSSGRIGATKSSWLSVVHDDHSVASIDIVTRNSYSMVNEGQRKVDEMSGIRLLSNMAEQECDCYCAL